ncbi:hypothetical protein I4U23_028760 [Adineta vaga]|nr:hypothetical protein I4U23_028760 [Adineta vaga]
MTSSNKVRRYLQHHKQQCLDSQNNHQSAADLLFIDPTITSSTSMRKFRARTQPPLSPSTAAIAAATVSIPQICIDDEDDPIDTNKPSDDDIDDYGHVAILDEFDQVLDNELKRNSLVRTSSLKQKEVNSAIEIPTNQQRSFSFALGSSTNLDGKHPDEEENINEPVHILPLSSKSTKLPATIKASLSKETFSRLLHSLAFRSGNHSSSKIAMSTTDSSTQQPSSPSCLACQNHPNLDLIPKHKKRPSIFGVLVSKLNTTTSTSIATTPTTENNSNRCSVCKRRLSKSIFYSTITNHIDEDKQQLSPSTQNFSSTSLTSSKLLHDHGQLLLRTKRRRSLPSLFHSLFDFDHHEKHHLNNKQIQHRPSFSSILTHTLFDTVTNEQQQPTSIAIIKQTSTTSYSSISLSESDDSEVNHNNQSFQRKSVTCDDSSQLTEKIRIDAEENGRIKDEYDKEIILDKDISSSDLNNMNTDESTNEYNPNQIFLHPPEIMLVRSSFRDTITKVKRQFQSNPFDSKERIHLIKYDSIDQLFVETNSKTSSKRSCSHTDLSNGRVLLTRPSTREKTRSLLVNVFRTRRSNVTLGSNETNMAGKQFSVSVINLTTSTGSNRNHSTSSMSNDSTHVNHLDQRKHALSEENLPTTTDGTYIYFIDVNGQNFRESLKYSDLSENTTLREILVQLFEKYQLNIERCNICLRSAPTLPLSLDQPVKHLLLNDLVVTGIKKNSNDS